MRISKLAGLAGCMIAAACAPEEVSVQQPRAMPDANPVEYPISMWDRRVEGETLLMVRVSERGAVDSAYVQTSSGFAEFDSAALAGARRLRFTPGRRGDHSVAMWTRLPVRFAMDSTATLGMPVGAEDSP